MADTACSFALSSVFNAKYDITWSFQYSLCGYAGCHGGFTTFLYSADVPSLVGGGIRSGLGYAPYEYRDFFGSTIYSGLSGAVLGVGFDSSGLFSTRQYGLNTGSLIAIPNSYTVRVSSDYVAAGYGSMPFEVLKDQDVFTALRFNLTNLGQTLNIDYRKTSTSPYTRVASIETSLLYLDDTYFKIGISYATPTSGASSAIFKVKDIHTHGVL